MSVPIPDMHPCRRALVKEKDATWHLPVAIGVARIDRPAAYAKDVLYEGPHLTAFHACMTELARLMDMINIPFKIAKPFHGHLALL